MRDFRRWAYARLMANTVRRLRAAPPLKLTLLEYVLLLPRWRRFPQR